jgi:O-methyltransferase involved in polyketide biosynthesis
MLWARDLYRSGSAARFYSHLDFSAGENLRQECERACPWYGEVLLNRKFWIRRLAGRFARETGQACQVIILAAGKSPLALELLDDCSNAIESVIETDIHGMAEKQQLYGASAPHHAEKIRCVSADLSDPSGTMDAIRRTGQYDSSLPACIILEGVSYYLPPAVLSGTAAQFASQGKNRIIFDYLLPCRLVPEEQQQYPRGVWRAINRDCNPGGTTTYSRQELDTLLAPAGCLRSVHHTMHAIERARTGTNRYFPSVAEGWIRIAEGWL